MAWTIKSKVELTSVLILFHKTGRSFIKTRSQDDKPDAWVKDVTNDAGFWHEGYALP